MTCPTLNMVSASSRFTCFVRGPELWEAQYPHGALLESMVGKVGFSLIKILVLWIKSFWRFSSNVLYNQECSPSATFNKQGSRTSLVTLTSVVFCIAVPWQPLARTGERAIDIMWLWSPGGLPHGSLTLYISKNTGQNMKQRFSGSRWQALQNSDPWEKGNSKVSSTVGQPDPGGTPQAARQGGGTQIKLGMPVAWRDRVQHQGSPRRLEVFGQSCRGKRQSSGAQLWGSAVCPLQFSACTEVPRGWERPWNRESGTFLRVHMGQKEVRSGHGALSRALRKLLLSIKVKMAQTKEFSEPT